MTSIISKWGVEIEAGFIPYCGGVGKCSINEKGGYCDHSTIDKGDFPPLWEIHHDGSVRVERMSGSSSVPGEVVSPPIENLSELKTQIEKVYERINRINSSMGFHVHVSMPKKIYYTLSSWDYIEWFQSNARRLFPEVAERIDRRDEGTYRAEDTSRVNYCKAFSTSKDFLKAYKEQVTRKDKHAFRYTSLNYAWARFRTIEYRAFPMQRSAGKLFTYLDFILENISSFLEKNKSNEIIKEKTEKDKDALKEENLILKVDPLNYITCVPRKIVITRKGIEPVPLGVPIYKFKKNDTVKLLYHNMMFTETYLTSKSILKQYRDIKGTIHEMAVYNSHDAFNGRRFYSVYFNNTSIWVDEADLVKLNPTTSTIPSYTPDSFVKIINPNDHELYGDIAIVFNVPAFNEVLSKYTVMVMPRRSPEIDIGCDEIMPIREFPGFGVLPLVDSRYILTKYTDTEEYLGSHRILPSLLRDRTILTAKGFRWYSDNSGSRKIYAKLSCETDLSDVIRVNVCLSDLTPFTERNQTVSRNPESHYCLLCDDTRMHTTEEHEDYEVSEEDME